MSASAVTGGLPIVSLAGAEATGAARAEFLRELREVARDPGFFYLKDNGVDQTLIDDVFKLSRRFFDLPLDDKLAIEMVNSPHFRGYTRIGWERTRNAPDWREQLDIGAERAALPDVPGNPGWNRLQGPNQWPAALPELKDPLLRYQAAVTDLAIRLLRLFAESLGERPDFFEPIYKDLPDQLVKIIRYPGREVAESEQGCGAHKDGGLLTFVAQHEQSGLEAETSSGWVAAPPIPGTFNVNIGELLEMASDGYLRATVHRVVAPPAGRDRLSVAFFLGGRLDARVSKIELPPELAAQARGQDQDEDPDNPLFLDVGVNRLKSRLRSHPDVARRHHADLLRADLLQKAG